MIIFASIDRTIEALKAIRNEHKTVASFVKKTQGMDNKGRFLYVETLLYEAKELV